MKKHLLTVALLGIAFAANAQVNVLMENGKDTVNTETSNSDVQSLNDVLKSQQNASNTTFNTDHYSDVWSRRTYANIAFNSATSQITEVPADDSAAPTGNFSNDWGLALIVGTNFKLHKPIANAIVFNVDFNCIELSMNRYKKASSYSYDSKEHHNATNDSYERPWNGSKFDINYGMSVGPSVTIAPFTHVNSNGLHFVKLNVYFNVGYNAALLFYNTGDINNSEYDKAKKTDWGHGLFTKFGANFSWKFIGFGYEHRVGTNKYRNFPGDVFGGDPYKVKTSINRVYIQFRFK